MSPEALRARLAREVVVADGAIGTELYQRGYGFERSFDALCLEAPDVLRALHRAYAQAGAQLLETNTFGANALRLAEHGLADRAAEIARAGAGLAREVADEAGGLLVAGSMGPLGVTLAPVGACRPGRAREAFAEQAAALAEGGADLLIIETMRDLEEARLALEAARSACDLPVVVLATFGEDGRTSTGASPEEVVEVLEAAGADVVGANCSTGPAPMLAVIERMASRATVPLAALPNAGLPRLVRGRFHYAGSPAYMAEVMGRIVDAGARLVGGCCGTTPEHIRALRAELEGRPVGRVPAMPAEREAAPAPADVRGPTAMQEALDAGGFVTALRMNPPRGFDVAPQLPPLAALRDQARPNVWIIADAPQGQARMSAMAAALLLRDGLGVQTVLEVGCHFRNLVATHSELLGAHALGLRDVLVAAGDLPANGDYPAASVIRDVTTVGLVGLLEGFNHGKEAGGRVADKPTSFFVGCELHLEAHDPEAEAERFLARVDAGARWAVTRPVFDAASVRAMAERVGGAFPVPLVTTLIPLASVRHAAYLHNEVPGIEIPERVLERMRRAGEGEGAAREGLALALELATEIAGQARGVCVQPSPDGIALAGTLLATLRQEVSA